MADLTQLFWQATAEEIRRGYISAGPPDRFICLLCGAEFVRGVIYPSGDLLYEAEKAVQAHLNDRHQSTFDYLLGLNKQYTGLTEQQRQFLVFSRQGLDDREIAGRLGVGSTSTVRNMRFKLREREKQAKVFLALLGSLTDNPAPGERLVTIPRGAKMVDERFAITEQERAKVLKTFFEAAGEGRLIGMPSREKRKIIVLQHVAGRFTPGRKYTEAEVNAILENVYHDFASLRRFLVDYGFLERTRDCKSYWVKV